MAEKKIKYLDPKNDLTFRKIFGEHPHILISFLNSLLPLEPKQKILSIEYLDNEIIPELPGLKRSVVDVRCKDNFDRFFIVEMQMYWTSSFKKRMLFNSGKAYVKQLKSGGKYRDLKPVYGLSLVDDIMFSNGKLKDDYYHHYKLVHTQVPEEQINGLELIFIELPKFKAKHYSDKRLFSLWLRFLTEIDENTINIPDDFKSDNLIMEAMECVQKDAFSEEELAYYEQYWDVIRTEKAALEDILEQKRILALEKEEAIAETKVIKEEIKTVREQIEAANQQIEAANQQIEAANQQIEAANQQLKAEKEKTQFVAEIIKPLIISLLKKGSTISEIAKTTGISENEIDEIIKRS